MNSKALCCYFCEACQQQYVYLLRIWLYLTKQYEGHIQPCFDSPSPVPNSHIVLAFAFHCLPSKYRGLSLLGQSIWLVKKLSERLFFGFLVIHILPWFEFQLYIWPPIYPSQKILCFRPPSLLRFGSASFVLLHVSLTPLRGERNSPSLIKFSMLVYLLQFLHM